jgi:RecB family exonuclease
MKHQLHVSGLNLLSKCGVAFENRVLKGLPEPRSVSLAVGSAVDRAVTLDLTSKQQTGSLLPDADVKDIARDAAVGEWERGDINLSEEDADEGWKGSKDEAIDAAVDMAAYHHVNAAPAIQPTHVQRAWVLDIAGMGDVQLAGTIDIQEGMKSIRDTKTSAKSPNKDTAEKSLQLTTYALAVRALDGRIPDTVNLDYVVRTPKRHDMKLVQLEARRTDDDLPHLIQRIQAAAATIQSGMFTPAPVDAWWCSRKFCGYWSICPYAARPASIGMTALLNDFVDINQQKEKQAA